MNIGIVGSGNMGRTIGLNWASKGHNVFFGHRRVEMLGSIKNIAGNIPIRTGTDMEAILNSDVILYCLRNTFPSEIAAQELWNGKTVIDLNNNWESLKTSGTDSLAYKYQQDIPGAHLVKAFNNHAQELFETDAYVLHKANTGSFYCGDNIAANAIVSGLIEDIGLTPIHSGPLSNAYILENMGHLIKFLMQQRGLMISYGLTAFPEPEEYKFGGRVASTIK